MQKAILALDQGTTSSRAIIFDRQGNILAQAQQEFHQAYPHAGWVEHDPLELWTTQLSVAHQALTQAHLSARDLAALGIANQRETTLLWDRETGTPVYPAIVWQDRRTASFCDELVAQGLTGQIQEITGLVVDAYFSASKIKWILDQVPAARRKANQGQLAFGTIDTWLLWNLTRGKLHLTDITNASRTLLFNLHTGNWDPFMLSLFDIPVEVLPEVRSSSEVYGETAPELFGGPIPIGGIAGDQQAALFGQNCFSRGMVKNTYGTGCFMLMNIGSKPIPSAHQLLTTVAWKLADQNRYALEGSVFIGGAVVQWLRDGLGLIRSSAEVEQLALTVPDNGGVSLVPAFAGLGAPHWDQYARGAILGMTRGTTAGHLARAALEGIALQVADVLEVMQNDSGIPIHELRVDGGAAANNLLMQFQADLLQVPVVRPTLTETTALGAAYLAGLAVGFWNDCVEIARLWQTERVFTPEMSVDEVAYRRRQWSKALERAGGWEQPRSGV